MSNEYIHGTDPTEQDRLRLLNELTNPPFLQFLELKSGDRVLEVGSGLGILATTIAGRLSSGRMFGLEYSHAQLSRAQRGSSNLAYIRGDAHSLPVLSGSFDVVYCRYLLEHVADPLRVLKEMRRVMVDGGRVYVQENDIVHSVFDPDCHTFYKLWQDFATLQAKLKGDALIGRKLFRLLKAAGFREIQLSFAPEIHHSGQESFRGWVINIIGNVRSGAEQLCRTGLATQQQIDLAIGELEALLQRDDASAYFYWNRAAAIK